MRTGPNRRAVLQGAAVAVVAGVAGFVAYALRDDQEVDDPAYTDSSGGETAGNVLAAVDDVPSGGGLILPDANVVLTRDGDAIQAFSATCTHQQCTVASVQNGRIACACHGSVFDAATGAVVNGPAQRPLPPVSVSVVDGSIMTA
jgi:Rieske Fe-S protein